MTGRSTVGVTHDHLRDEVEQLLVAFSSGDAGAIEEVAQAKRETIR